MNELKNLVNELTENHPKQMIDRIDNILQEFKLEYLEARITHKGLDFQLTPQ